MKPPSASTIDLFMAQESEEEEEVETEDVLLNEIVMRLKSRKDKISTEFGERSTDILTKSTEDSSPFPRSEEPAIVAEVEKELVPGILMMCRPHLGLHTINQNLCLLICVIQNFNDVSILKPCFLMSAFLK